ncbi:type I-C CRISPR-associated protein Cas8c/Csd1 [Actinophytocola sediminis]
MLLTRLVEYARTDPAVPPAYYASKLLRWIVELNGDGSPASPQLTDLADPTERTRRNGIPHVVPAVQRSGTGAQPMLAADTAEYALGWSTDETRAAKSARYHAAFRDLALRWHQADQSAESSALRDFLTGQHADTLVRPAELTGNHLVAFRVAGRFLHADTGAQRFWAGEAEGRKGSTREGLCLVCGQSGPLLQTIPRQLPTRLVPGAQNSAPLVSLNKTVHGFNLQKQLVHVPICTICGLQSMGALESLLAGENSATYPGQDARLTWWVTENAEFDLRTLDDPSPEDVADMIGGPARGGPNEVEDLSVFCSLAIGGNVARVVVREWIEQPLPHIRANLRSWFDDHQMVDMWTGLPQYVGTRRMAQAAGRWAPGRGEDNGSYVRFGATGADRPDDVYRRLLASALLNKTLPPRLLAHVVHRIRTDGRIDTARAALIRLALRRQPGISNPEDYMPVLNPENNQPAYLAGRIFAVLSELQYQANRARGSEPLNTTFGDRYFSRAVTSPAVALVTGRRTARAWLRVLRRRNPAATRAIEARMDELFDQLAVAGGIPHGTVLAEKAAFILGYHQERAAARAQRTKNTTTASNTDTDGVPA